MKPIGGHGEPVQHGIFTAEELLRYAMSLPVTTTITGVEKIEILEQNLKVAQGFTPLSDRRNASRSATAPRQYAADGRFELYKTSIKFDNPEARLAHDFPLDLQQIEVTPDGLRHQQHRPSLPRGQAGSTGLRPQSRDIALMNRRNASSPAARSLE